MTKKIDVEERRKQMRQMYEDGYTLPEICEELGYKTTEYVQDELRKLGVYVKYPFGIDVPKVLALRRAGWDMKKIIEEFNHEYTATQINMAVAFENERRANRNDISKKAEQKDS